MTWRWLPTYPTTDSRLYEVPALISDNFTGIETILDVEHQTLTSGASGQHSPGRVSAVYEGTTAQITALTDVPEGALAYDTTIGYWKKYIGGWVVMTNIHSRMRAFLSAATSAVTASTQSTTGDWIFFNTENYDELSEYDTGKITTSIARSRDANTTSLTANASHGLSAGDAVNIIGLGGMGYNGEYTVASTPSTIVFTYSNTAVNESYTADTGGVFRHGGVFTAKGNGDYLIILSVAICASAPIPTTSIPGTATGNETAQWVPVGGINYQTIDEYPTANDADYVTTHISGAKDRYTQSKTGQEAVPLDSTGLSLTVAYRIKGIGCSCNAACYGHMCTCYALCYGYVAGSCTCNSTCYGYVSCTCDYVCYGYSDPPCTCDTSCDGYVSCSCDATCYVYVPYASCSCDNACYQDSQCTCYGVCYGYGCTCNNLCYGYAGCSCNVTCYGQSKGCDCDYTCYGYVSCSCNYAAYGYTSCTCNVTCYVEGGSACQCYTMCYDEFKTTVAPLVTLSGSTGWVEYLGAVQAPTNSFQLLEYTWSVSPSTGLDWVKEELNKVGHFGLKAFNDAGITTGCSAVVSQEYITFGWYPVLPVYILRLYKNNIEIKKVFCPINDAGTESDQSIGINTILTLDLGDTLRVAFVKASNVADYIIGNAAGTLTYMSVHRIEGQCV